MAYINGLAQSVTVYAFDEFGNRVTGDQANITCQISKDGGTSAATSDVNPTQLESTDHPGAYIFNLVLAETQADVVDLAPVSSTAGVTLEPVTIRTVDGLDLYKDGFVYLDPAAANTTTVNFIDGLHDNAVSTYLAAKTIAASLGLSVRFVNGAFVSIAEAITGIIRCDPDVSINLDLGNFNNADVEGFTRVGDALVATDSRFRNVVSELGLTNSFTRCEFYDCILKGTDTSQLNGNNSLYNCYLGEAWNLNTAGDLSVVGCYADDMTYNMFSDASEFKGSIDGTIALATMTNAAGVIDLAGTLDVVINTGCTNGNIKLTGTGSVVDNSGAGCTVDLTAFNPVGIAGVVDANLVQINSDPQSMTDLKDFADDGYDPATNKVAGVLLTDTTTTLTNKTGFSLAATGLDLILSTSTAFVAMAKAVWDTILTGGTFNITNSSGKRLRVLSGQVFEDGTAQSGGDNSIRIAAGQVTFDNQWKRTKVILVSGAGAGQEAIVTSSDALTDTLTITPSWIGANPAVGTEYEILPGQSHSTTRNGGYDNGHVFVDSNSGNVGTEIGVDCTSTHKGSLLSDAFIVAASADVNSSAFDISPGSTITLPGATVSKQFNGSEYNVLLAGKDISGTRFTGAQDITGVSTGSGSSFFQCGIRDLTIGPSAGLTMGLTGTITLLPGNYNWGNAGTLAVGTAIIDFDNPASTTVVNLSDFAGLAVEFQNANSNCTAVVLAVTAATVTVNANCTDLELIVNSNVIVTDAGTTTDTLCLPSKVNVIEWAGQDLLTGANMVEFNSGSTRFTAKALETSAVADVSALALEASVQTIITTGGAGPWATGATPADVWSYVSRTVTAATNITSDGTAIGTLSGKVLGVGTVDVTTLNTDMRGTNSANTVVPMAAALSQTEHDSTQNLINLVPKSVMEYDTTNSDGSAAKNSLYTSLHAGFHSTTSVGTDTLTIYQTDDITVHSTFSLLAEANPDGINTISS